MAEARLNPSRYMMPAAPSQNSEIYTYESESALFALGWSVRADKPFRFAVGSFLEEHDNYVEIVQLDAERDELVADPNLRIAHPYPPTKALFLPDTNTSHPDLMATSSDYLRIWKIRSNEVVCDRLLMNSKGGYSAPITSIDWNDQDIKRIGVASIDTTCTIWDIEKGQVDMQMITHDKEIYDIAWGGVGVFASVSADGSVRIFDVRDKEHSTIVYRSPGPEVVPLLRLGWNKQDPRYIAVLGMASTQVLVLDIRFPSMPVAELDQHAAPVNALAWAPNSQLHICTAGDDSRALIWDLSKLSGKALDPVLSYNAASEVTSLQWSTLHPDRVAICFGKQAQLLRV